jgi:predicted HD phosphohydrolase
MNVDEVREFESSAYAGMGARLRRWDDMAKVVGRKTPGLEKYQPMLKRLAMA